MTKQALIELRDNIAAGAYDATNTRVAQFNRFVYDFEAAFGVYTTLNYNTAWQACNNSLDAAVAFLEAVLPGSDWVVRTCDPNEPDAAYAHTWLGDLPSISGVHHEYWADTPARALLLATLEALIARAE